MFKRAGSDIQFIAVTFILVVLLGARTFASLTEPDEVSAMSAVASSSSLAVSSSSRAPASVPEMTLAPKKIESTLHQSADYDLNCSKKSIKQVAVKGAYIQFRGKSCVRGFRVAEMEIINKSNGYTASVFDRGSDKYQTDLIQLQQGENEITFRYHEASGKTVEEIIHITSPKI